MSLAPDSFSSRRETLVFVICLILSIAARMAPPAVQTAVASAVSSTVVAPFLALQRQAALLKAARGRYAEVTGLRDSALVAAFESQALREENQGLRQLLALSARLPVAHVSAEVLHQAAPTAGLIAVLSAGASRGVRPRAPVIAPGGLVGVVRNVTGSTSVALLWPHPDFRVSAMTPDGSVFGIVAPRGGEGPNTMLLELRGVPYRERIDSGTEIYTSGLGGVQGVYPRGLPIGEIVAVAEEQAGWSRTYVVRPHVHPASISHVVILTGGALDLRDVVPEARPR